MDSAYPVILALLVIVQAGIAFEGNLRNSQGSVWPWWFATGTVLLLSVLVVIFQTKSQATKDAEFKRMLERLPKTELSTSELVEKATLLAADIRRLAADARSQEDTLGEQAKKEAPRNREKEFNAIRENEMSEFEQKYLGNYVYLYQEIVYRLPDKYVPNPFQGHREVGGYLAVGGLFGRTRDLDILDNQMRDLVRQVPWRQIDATEGNW